MLIIGLTGGIACGKSLVSHYFEQLDVPVIDTDIIAKQLVEPGQAALTEIIDLFGTGILDDSNQLNRQLLRDIIFKSPNKRHQLEAILHPKIHSIVLKKIAILNKKNNLSSNKIPYCIIVVPLLFEAKINYPIDRILLIDCTEEQQIERSMKRDNITREQSLAIISNQTPHAERLEKTDDIIKNDSDQDSCQSHVKQIHQNYLKLSKVN